MFKQQTAKHTCCGTSNRWKFYWWSYHSSNYPISWIIKLIEDVVKELGDPWERARRGSPPKFSPKKHAFICFLTSYMNWSLRQAEAWLPLLRIEIDHSTIGKAYQPLPEGYVREAERLMGWKIRQLLGSSRLYVGDATNLCCDRVKGKRMVALKKLSYGEHEKLCLIVEERQGLLSIVDALAAKGEAHENPMLKQMLREDKLEGRFLGDSAFDDEEV